MAESCKEQIIFQTTDISTMARTAKLHDFIIRLIQLSFDSTSKIPFKYAVNYQFTTKLVVADKHTNELVWKKMATPAENAAFIACTPQPHFVRIIHLIFIKEAVKCNWRLRLKKTPQLFMLTLKTRV